MPLYIMLSQSTSEGLRLLRKDPDLLDDVRRQVEALDAKIVHRYALPGTLGFMTVVDAPNNLGAFRLAVERHSTGRVRTDILPAIDLDLFVRLLSQTTETVGPYRWQTSLWARVIRRLLQYDTFTRQVRTYCKPLTIEGREHLKNLKGTVIFIGNHSSHMDAPVLFHTLPPRFRQRIAWGAAADRWFIKGRKGIKKQPWYMALTMNAFPVHRGGGRAALSYAEELLGRGWSLVIFPEGTRTTTGKMGHFRQGVSILALAKNVPVVPIWLEGLRALRPKGATETRPGPTLARIGPPIHFAPGTAVPEATHTLYRTMEKMRDDLRRARHPIHIVEQARAELTPVEPAQTDQAESDRARSVD
jgi:1-acyl-sn-glycerol-3-phosphate acyltransferase